MADTKSAVKEISAKLEQGVKDVFTSEKFADYLKTMSRFHRYSTRNTILIHMQRPKATYVAGKRRWEREFERHVKERERGIRILAPTPFKIKEERQKIDPDTKKPVIGDDGLPETETVERQFARFKVVKVYDVSQTYGKPLPSLAEELDGSVKRYGLFMDALRGISPLPISFAQFEQGHDGRCIMGEKIELREGMGEAQTVCAAIHEITHAVLHDLEANRLLDENAKPKDRTTEELEAEGTSFAVCSYFGIDTGANSFGYIAQWSKNRELKELNAALDTIRKAAADLIGKISDKYQDLAKERGIDLDATAETDGIGLDAADETSDAMPEKTQAYKPSSDEVYDRFADIVAAASARFAVSSGTLTYTDETEARRACNQILYRVVNDMLLKSDDSYHVFDKYMADPAFKERLEEYVFVKAYLEQVNSEPGYQENREGLIMPDDRVTVRDRNDYGYTKEDMLPLTCLRAAELHDSGHVVYLLYQGNRDAVAFDGDEIIDHDGMCGIEKDDWLKSPVLAAEIKEAESKEARRESELLYGTKNDGMFGIYQLRSNTDMIRSLAFAPMNELKDRGFEVDRGNYKLIYTAPLTIRDITTNLNKIYEGFQGENPARPPGFTGHSISVSDVIVLQWRGNVSAHYVDSIGFKELPSFTGDEGQRETQPYSQFGNNQEPQGQGTSTYNVPPAAELKAQADSGGTVSILGLAAAAAAERRAGYPQQAIAKDRPSLMDRLEANKIRAASEPSGGMTAQSAEMEVQ